MSDTKASEAGRELVRHRWGAQAVERAARTVIERVDELPVTVRAQVHLATADQDQEDGDE
jgi:hypothetical protein